MIRFTWCFCLLWICTAVQAQQAAGAAPGEGQGLFPVDSVLREYLGEVLCQQMDRMKSVRFHAVDPIPTDSLALANVYGYPVRKTVLLKPELREAFLSVLGRADSYYLGSRVKMCYFLPDMALQLQQGTDTVSVLISLECDLVRYHYRDAAAQPTSITLNSDYSHEALEHLYRQCLKLKETVPAKVEIPEPEELVREEENLGLSMSRPLYLTVRPGEGWTHLAKRASKEFKQKILVQDICKINNIDYDKAMTNTVQPQKGQELLVGYKH